MSTAPAPLLSVTPGRCDVQHVRTGWEVVGFFEDRRPTWSARYPNTRDGRNDAWARRDALEADGADAEVRAVTHPVTTCRTCRVSFEGLPYGLHVCATTAEDADAVAVAAIGDALEVVRGAIHRGALLDTYRALDPCDLPGFLDLATLARNLTTTYTTTRKGTRTR